MGDWFESNDIRMPQLDIVTYVTQYLGTLIVLLILFSLIVIGILPKIQQQLGLRASAEEGLIGSDENILVSSEKNNEAQSLGVEESESMKKAIEILRDICNQK